MKRHSDLSDVLSITASRQKSGIPANAISPVASSGVRT
jgi:hypothetical protein